MYKLHYPRLIISMLKEPPILKIIFCTAGYDTPRNHIQVWLSPQIQNGYEKIFWAMNQGPIWGWFTKKNRGQKSRAAVPLRYSSPRRIWRKVHRFFLAVGIAPLECATFRWICFVWLLLDASGWIEAIFWSNISKKGTVQVLLLIW